jgi:diaminopimelate epimerase
LHEVTTGGRRPEPGGRKIRFAKAHAYENDFLLVRSDQLAGEDPAALAEAMCHRHAGIGADGLILFEPEDRGAAMRLLNADGSPSEVSGNGVRCLAALLLRERGEMREILIATDAGAKRLTLLDTEDPRDPRNPRTRMTFRAAMGPPEELRVVDLEAAGERVKAIVLRVGNPQCVVLGEVSEDRLHRLGPALSRHRFFPAGTNVELASVEDPSRVRILIWERGVGPTQASGTGACAAAVAAAAYGGASRDVEIVSPGGAQRVEWTDAGLFLTGWSEVICEGLWLRHA